MSDNETEGYNCRVCFETFTDRTQVIVPCKCSGSSKYICKGCLNTYINHDKNDIKYTTCPSCKSKYIREQHNIPITVNDETRDEILYGISIVTLITLGFLIAGKISSTYIFFVLLLYFYAITIFIASSNWCIYWLIIALYCAILFTPREISYYIYSLCLILLFGYTCKNIISEKWEYLNKTKILRLTQALNCKMFDFGIGRYVTGVV